jgi:hypothetical protein
LKFAHNQAASDLAKGARSKSEYGDMMMNYEKAEAPRFYTSKSSIFVESLSEFLNVYPPEAAQEIEHLVNSLGNVFGEYEGVKYLDFLVSKGGSRGAPK